MARAIRLFDCALLVGFGSALCSAITAQAENRVAIEFFHDDLSPDGVDARASLDAGSDIDAASRSSAIQLR